MRLYKFIKEHKIYFDIAKKELMSGKKETHWMWFIFPQISGLGHSSICCYFSLKDLDEARAYYENDYLKSNMDCLIEIIMGYQNKDIVSVFGYVDAKKLRSCMTLFYLATSDKKFKDVLDKYYDGSLCELTLKRV